MCYFASVKNTRGHIMPQEIMQNLSVPAQLLECYGAPWNLIQELLHRGAQK